MQVRGGMNFDPGKYLKEVMNFWIKNAHSNHVTKSAIQSCDLNSYSMAHRFRKESQWIKAAKP